MILTKTKSQCWDQKRKKKKEEGNKTEKTVKKRQTEKVA